MQEKSKKPLGRKAYGSIGHLLGSRLGPGDHHVSPGQDKICTEKVRDKHDLIICQEKLDGSCVAVAKLADGSLVALGRAGWLAQTSPYEQHQWFAVWVRSQHDRFDKLLRPGERVAGEWLAQAHGTRYALPHEAFVAFDLLREDVRVPFDEFCQRVHFNPDVNFEIPSLLFFGHQSCSVEKALGLIRHTDHGALDPVEGVVWRVERNGKVDFLAKYVRPDKQDGCYLPEVSGKPPVWNWRPHPHP